MNRDSDLHAQIQELSVEVAVLKTRLGASESALSLQAKEYERRLESLNSAHQQAEKVQHTYVTREMHDQLYAEMVRRLETVDKANNGFVTRAEFDRVKDDVTQIGQTASTLSTKNATLAAVFAAALALANLAFVMWHSLGGTITR